MAKSMKHASVFILMIAMLAISEATPPGIANNPSQSTCSNGKYKYCKNLVHVCPKFCPNGCTTECVSCKPICIGGTTAPGNPGPDPNTPAPQTPGPKVPPSDDESGKDKGSGDESDKNKGSGDKSDKGKGSGGESDKNKGSGGEAGKGAKSPPEDDQSGSDKNSPHIPPSYPTPTVTPTPSNPTPSTPTPATPSSPSPSTPTPSPLTPSTPTPTTPSSPSPSTPTPSPLTPSTPTPTTPSPSTPTPSPLTPSTPTPTTPSPSTPTPSPLTPSTPTPTTPSSPSPSTPTPSPLTPSTPESTPTPSTPTPSTPSNSSPTPTSPSTTPTPPDTSSPSYPPTASGKKRARCKNKKYGQCYNLEHVCPSDCPGGCEVDCVSCKPVCKCDMPGAVCQDPRFIGGNGITFYFHGKKDQDFCLVSDTNIHINGHFIGKRSPNMTRDFTWVQSIGILFGSHKLFVGAQKTATWSDSVDRLALAFDGEPIFLPDGQGSRWQSEIAQDVSITRVGNTNNIVIEVKGNFNITAKVTPITEEESRVHNYGIKEDDCFAHLDLGFKFDSLSDQVNGVLGQTYGHNYVSKVKMGISMPVIGGEREFSSSSLFSTDCSVSQFNMGASPMSLDMASLSCGSGMDGVGVVCKR